MAYERVCVLSTLYMEIIRLQATFKLHIWQIQTYFEGMSGFVAQYGQEDSRCLTLVLDN